MTSPRRTSRPMPDGADDVSNSSTSEFRDIYQAITHLERKLTDALNTGLQTLQLAIQTLADAHSAARLEQERRNATFATAQRLDDLIRVVDAHTAQMAARAESMKSIQEQNTRQEAAIAALTVKVDDQGNGFLKDINGYLFSAIMFGGGAVLSFLLQHVIK